MNVDLLMVIQSAQIVHAVETMDMVVLKMLVGILVVYLVLEVMGDGV